MEYEGSYVNDVCSGYTAILGYELGIFEFENPK